MDFTEQFICRIYIFHETMTKEWRSKILSQTSMIEPGDRSITAEVEKIGVCDPH